MKQLILLFFILLSYCSISQLSKGDLYLGGSLSYSSSNYKSYINSNSTFKDTSKQFVIKTELNYLVSKKLSIFAGLGYVWNFIASNVEDTKITYKPIFPYKFGVMYYHEITPKFNLQLKLNNEFTVYRSKSENTGGVDGTNFIVSDSRISIYELSVSPGISYFLNKNFSINLSIGKLYYSHRKNHLQYSNGLDNSETSIEDNISISLANSGIDFGILYKIKSKKVI